MYLSFLLKLLVASILQKIHFDYSNYSFLFLFLSEINDAGKN